MNSAGLSGLPYRGDGAGDNEHGTPNASLQSLQQATVMVRQLQMMQQQTAGRLRDLQTLASLPPELQQLAAERLQLGPGMLQPQMLQQQMQQLQQVLQQYQMQVIQVQMQQQRLQAQVQAQQQQQHPHHHQHPHHQQMHHLANSSSAMVNHLAAERLGSLHNHAVQPNQPKYLPPNAANAFSTGDRYRVQQMAANRRKGKRDQSPDPEGMLDGLPLPMSHNMQPTRESSRSRKRINYAEAEAFAAITDDEEADVDSEDERQKAKQKNAVAAFDDTSELDDEVEKVLGHRDAEGVEPVPGDTYANKEFYVKWRHWSHIHCSWDTRETLYQLAGYKRVQNYIKRMEDLDRRRRVLSREEIELIDVERELEFDLAMQHQNIERIVAERHDAKTGEKKYLVKWQGLPYGETTWELVSDVMKHGGKQHIDEYLARELRVMQPPQTVDAARRGFLQRHRAMCEQPTFLAGGGELRDYQLQSLNWMIYSWLQATNIILADEMGLGKTVQCASVIGYFTEVLKIYGPFLIVVPLSTVPNWIKEFRKWVPNVNAVVYVGDTKSREVIREFEFCNKRRSDREFKFEALITTYELVLKDSEVLSQIRWNFLVVDEAHRLKNNESALYKELCTWSFRNKLLVTGTPLQNSVKELWALLHFLEPMRFPSPEEFEAKYDLKNSESVSQLHADLKPHLLRRVIKDVEKSLPPKNERILRVDMTPLQRQYYKWVLTRNFKELNKRGRAQVTLLNIISDLKKCCNHPFLFESAEEEYKGTDETSMIDRLVRTSGKMVLLDKLLLRLKSAGHRVLLFSQMVHMLDIISDYMRMRGWQHQRLDGSTPPQQRHQAMEQFNAENSRDFAFLLSTRAGGLGINLATADTVIIFDSDWNPQNDLQAMSRAHRIGQKSLVNIYRFVTMGSVEQDILERAKRKMVLDHVIIQRMDTSGRTVLDPNGAGKDMFDKGELAAILRFGAENLFQEDAGGKAKEEVQARDRQLYEEDIDAILARAEVVDNRVQEEADEQKNELLSAFNVATFKNEEDDATFWNRLLPSDQLADMGGKKGKKGKHADADGDLLLPRTARLRAAGAFGDPPPKGRKSRTRTLEAPPPGVVIDVSVWPRLCDAAGNPAPSSDPSWDVPEGLSRRDAHIFLRGMRRYARIEKLPEICADIGDPLTDAPPEAKYALWHGLDNACRDALAAVDAQGLEPKDAQVEFFGNTVKALELSQHINAMRLLTAQIATLPDPYEMFSLDADTQLAPPKWSPANGWGVHDDSMLLLGSYLYGICHWDRMAADERLGLSYKLSGAVRDGAKVGDKHFPQASHIETRVTALLKRIERSRNPNAIQVRPGRKSKKGLGGMGTPEKRAAPVRATKRGRGRLAEEDREAACVQALEPVLSELKKLRLLSRSVADIPAARHAAKTRKYLLAVGDHIVAAPSGSASGAPEHGDLWTYVAEFSEADCDGEALRQRYEHMDDKRAAAGAADYDDEGDEGDEGLEATPGGSEAAGNTRGHASAADEDDDDDAYADEHDDEDEEPEQREDDDEDWRG